MNRLRHRIAMMLEVGLHDHVVFSELVPFESLPAYIAGFDIGLLFIVRSTTRADRRI